MAASYSRVFSVVAKALASLAVALVTVWGCFALWFCVSHWVFALVVELWVAACCGSIVLMWKRKTWMALGVFASAMAVMLIWWSTLLPSDSRRWADDVALHVDSKLEGDHVTLYGVRDFTWRTPTDYDIRWDTRTYDLKQLQSVDVVCSYWMGPAIAHTLVSFGFADGQYVTFSIEIRKELGEEFSAIGGFFKQFETTLIAADENDILKVRTNVRGEDDYIYRVRMPVEAMRSLFMAYLDEARKLRERPQWYNTALANCTTIVYAMAKHIDSSLPLDYRLLVSGYLPEYLYDQKRLAPGVDFPTLHERARFTERARNATTDFSAAIRVGVP